MTVVDGAGVVVTGGGEGVREILNGARGYLGEIDIYCPNAGTGAGAGPDTAEEAK